MTVLEPVDVAESFPARSTLPGPDHRSYRGAARAVIAAMVSGAALVTGWTVALAIAASGALLLAPLTAHVSGMLAGYAVVLLVVLMSRWPVLDRGLGSDRLARWHATGGRTVLTLVLVHATAAIQVAWALMYTHAFGIVVRYRVVAPMRAATRHRLRVAQGVPEADGVVSIVIEGQHVDELCAEPGQFFRWRFLTPDLWFATHPLSLSAPPTSSRLRLT